MSNLNVNSTTFTIISSLCMNVDTIMTLASGNCTLVLPIDDCSQHLLNQSPCNIISNYSYNIFFTPIFSPGTDSIYAAANRVEALCANCSIADSKLVVILDSSVVSIITFNFSRPHSYLLCFRNDSHDYSFEYIEFIIQKFNKAGYAFISSTEIRKKQELISAINRKQSIFLYVYDKQSINEKQMLDFSKQIGTFLMRQINI